MNITIKNKFPGIQISAKESCSPEDIENAPDLTIDVFWGIDGVAVIEIRTENLQDQDPNQGPILRVYLNDDPIYENPPFPEEGKDDE